MTETKISYAVYDSDPAVVTPGRAYVYIGWRWREAHSAVVSMEAKSLPEEVFRHVFYNVPPSPLHGGEPADPVDYDSYIRRG